MSDFNPYDQRRRRGSWLSAVILALAIILVSLLLKGQFHERGVPTTKIDVIGGICLDAAAPTRPSVGRSTRVDVFHDLPQG
jgi:hypothetical protein